MRREIRKKNKTMETEKPPIYAQYDIAAKILKDARRDYIELSYIGRKPKCLSQKDFDCLSLYVNYITQSKFIIEDAIDYRDSMCHIEFLSPKAKLDSTRYGNLLTQNKRRNTQKV